MQYQIRRYEIDPANLDVFVQEWKASIAPLRERLGFQVHGAWIEESSAEFFWILSHDDPEGFAAADAAYYASDERKALSPNPARNIRGTEEVDVRRVW